MTCRRRIATFVVMLLGALAPARGETPRADLGWMSGEEIRERFSGKDIAGVYPNDQLWSERIEADGRTDYREAEKHWQGQWWVTAREFCFIYPPPGLGGCFRVVRINRNCYELYETIGRLGQAETPPALAEGWNGRMWLASEPPTCPERPIS
jgi:hypothetical protein